MHTIILCKIHNYLDSITQHVLIFKKRLKNGTVKRHFKQFSHHNWALPHCCYKINHLEKSQYEYLFSFFLPVKFLNKQFRVTFVVVSGIKNWFFFGYFPLAIKLIENRFGNYLNFSSSSSNVTWFLSRKSYIHRICMTL